MDKVVTNVLNSDRGGAVNFRQSSHWNNPSFGQQYFGDSFQVQRESLNNLANEIDMELLRDVFPHSANIH